MSVKKFKGTKSYIATDDLQVAVNAAITLERPLLVKGEPGTGKTMLAHEVAEALELDIITWHIKSTSLAQQDRHDSCKSVPNLEIRCPIAVQVGNVDVGDVGKSAFVHEFVHDLRGESTVAVTQMNPQQLAASDRDVLVTIPI